MPTYDFHCNKCDIPYQMVVKMSEYDNLVKRLVCDKCHTKLDRVFLTAPLVNLGWDNQAAGNGNKYWGTKPIVPISIGNQDGSTTVIGNPEDL